MKYITQVSADVMTEVISKGEIKALDIILDLVFIRLLLKIYLLLFRMQKLDTENIVHYSVIQERFRS